ncbi:hypothetical protein HC891_25135, partial [Candidatus Gracilibacteria bacterium]|nr:hypothetical protein [Candidatus Gracilibacteria bacterium]
MQTHVVIPVKNLAQAKSRLSTALDAVERRALVLEMLGRMLHLLLGMRRHGSDRRGLGVDQRRAGARFCRAARGAVYAGCCWLDVNGALDSTGHAAP